MQPDLSEALTHLNNNRNLRLQHSAKIFMVFRGWILRFWWSTDLCWLMFGAYVNICVDESANTYSDNHGPQRMNPNDYADPTTLPLVPIWGWNLGFWLKCLNNSRRYWNDTDSCSPQINCIHLIYWVFIKCWHHLKTEYLPNPKTHQPQLHFVLSAQWQMFAS